MASEPVQSALTPEKFVYLRDQLSLTPPEWDMAQRALAYVRNVYDERDQRVRDLGLDEEVWLPAANWDRSQAFYQNFDAIYEPRNLPLMRIYSHQFTGHRLCSLGGTIDAVPGQPAAELDERFAELQDSALNYLDSYFARVATLPPYLHVSPPAKFGEVGWQLRSKLINHDTVAYLERLALLYHAGLLDQKSRLSLFKRARPRILEIGGGYGGLAYFIKQVLPAARYTIVDLPESLAFSAVYLGALYHHEDIRFGCSESLQAKQPGCSLLPNFEFPSLVKAGASFDLVINTLSLSEMSEPQIRAYCEGISKLIGNDGYFFEQNQDNRHLGFQFARNIIQEYFPHRVELGGPWEVISETTSEHSGGRPRMHVAHGFANLWANRPIPAEAPHHRLKKKILRKLARVKARGERWLKRRTTPQHV